MIIQNFDLEQAREAESSPGWTRFGFFPTASLKARSVFVMRDRSIFRRHGATALLERRAPQPR